MVRRLICLIIFISLPSIISKQTNDNRNTSIKNINYTYNEFGGNRFLWRSVNRHRATWRDKFAERQRKRLRQIRLQNVVLQRSRRRKARVEPERYVARPTRTGRVVQNETIHALACTYLSNANVNIDIEHQQIENSFEDLF